MRHSRGERAPHAASLLPLPDLPDLCPTYCPTSQPAWRKGVPDLPDLFFAHTYVKCPDLISFYIYIQVGQVGQVGQSQQWRGFQGCPTSVGQVGQVGQAVEAARRAGSPQRLGMRAQRAQKPSSDRGLALVRHGSEVGA